MIGQIDMFHESSDLPLRKRVSLQIVTTATVRSALVKYHYLHRARTGRQLNYEVSIDGVVDGVITFAYPMMSAPVNGVPSDEMVEFARLYLHSNIPHSASCAAGRHSSESRRIGRKRFRHQNQYEWLYRGPTQHVTWALSIKPPILSMMELVEGGVHGNSEISKRGARVAHDDYKHSKDRWIYMLDR